MLKKVLSITLALVLLTNHLSLGLSSHLCMGEVVETQLVLGSTELSCGMNSEVSPCALPGSGLPYLAAPPCCETTLQSLSAELDLTSPALFQLQAPALVPMAWPEWASALHTAPATKAGVHYTPPPLPPPAPTQLQVFRL